MVEDRKILDLQDKLEKVLKRLPCRKLKLSSLQLKALDSGQKVVIISISLPDNFDSNPFTTVFDWNDDVDVKVVVNKTLQQLPAELKSIRVQNLETALQSISYNFSSKNLPTDFNIVKLPYRQLAISNNSNETIFINLCTSSYQRLLSTLGRSWRPVIDFSEIVNCMKRKELVTLLLTLTSNVQ